MKCQILEQYNCPWGKIIRVRIPNDCLKLNDIVRDANEKNLRLQELGLDHLKSMMVIMKLI